VATSIPVHVIERDNCEKMVCGACNCRTVRAPFDYRMFSGGLTMPRVVFTSNLQRHLECPEREVEGATVAQALAAVFAQVPRAREYVLDEHGEVRKHVVIYVDGRRIADRKRLSDAVTPGSEVFVLQALSGG
jgi:sulfur-carrier protein